jgi:DNA-directed RNA polymerase subunit RPC12/RpoP
MSDRKYRHRGYQDDDHDRERQQKQKPKGDGVHRYDSGPRGRGLGAPTRIAFKCARCGHELADPEITTATTCTSCGDALHSCANCTFFNTGSRFECQKPITARMESKTKGNDCEYFSPKAVRDLKIEAQQGGTANDPRAAFDALFKK